MKNQKNLKWGDVLKPSKTGISQLIDLYSYSRGIFLGICPRDHNLIRVVLQDCSSPVTYHIDFWERCKCLPK